MLTDLQSYYLLILPFLLLYLVGKLLSYIREFMKDKIVLNYIDYRLIPTLKATIIGLILAFPVIIFIDKKGLILSIISPLIVIGISITFIQFCHLHTSDQTKLIKSIREEKLIETNSNEVVKEMKKILYYFGVLICISALVMIWCISTVL